MKINAINTLPLEAEFVTHRGWWLDSGFFVENKPNGLPWRWRDYPAKTDLALDKPNIQLFRHDDELTNGMFDVCNRVNELQQAELWELKDTFSTSQHFGRFLWDNQLFDLARFFSRVYWSKNYEAIIAAMKIAGTYEAYIIVVNSALGDGLITFDNPSPGHLIITVKAGDVFRPWSVALADGTMTSLHTGGSNYDGKLLTLVDSAAQLTFQETIKLIELLNVSGMFVEIIPA
ncbi:hypothetical protein [Aeromonas sp. MR16]|uniref:hypothetical protein n=1 Tax=Aeromonas sp. MR16 TaxID=2923420 RepID=UPI001F4B8B5A|nr:hypothetical protein [Aeromonas sp. MR16]MCH7370035.1 hypothetical protein [Aeromonas sp. MR16]